MKPQTYFVSLTTEFRNLARKLPQHSDIILEVGASLGITTEILAKKSDNVIGIEHSRELSQALAKKFLDCPNVKIFRHDARDIFTLMEKVPRIDILFFDIGGDAPAYSAVYLLGLYMAAYNPRIAVIRNISLAALLGDVQLTEFPSKKNYQRYKSLPRPEDVLEHYRRENRRSATKYLDFKLKKCPKQKKLSPLIYEETILEG